MSWLLDHLIAAGHVTETGLTRRARIRTCRRCRTSVLVGLDSDICALETSCDPQPLSRLGEALAHLDGRRTYSLRREGPGWVIDWRDSHHITDDPAGGRPRQDILATHRCDHPTPSAWTTATTFPEATPKLPAGSKPPF